MISKASRYDIKGRKYIGANLKYYFTDLGLRNARLNFRQQEPTHIMKNIVYNELLVRGYNVDQESNSLRSIPDSFKKIVIVNGSKKPWRNDDGFVIMGMKYFLLNADSLEF